MGDIIPFPGRPAESPTRTAALRRQWQQLDEVERRAIELAIEIVVVAKKQPASEK